MKNKAKSYLNEAISDEKSAPKMYQKLKAKLKKRKDKLIIAKIIRDEKKHFQKLKKMKMRLK